MHTNGTGKFWLSWVCFQWSDQTPSISRTLSSSISISRKKYAWLLCKKMALTLENHVYNLILLPISSWAGVTCPLHALRTRTKVHRCVEKFLLSRSFLSQSLRKWLICQAVADYSSLQELNRENSNRQEYFYNTLYLLSKFAVETLVKAFSLFRRTCLLVTCRLLDWKVVDKLA